MSTEVSLAEFEYFRDERIPLDAIRLGSRLLLFACLVEEPVTPEHAELIHEKIHNGQQHFYGKAQCEIIARRLLHPLYADKLSNFLEGQLINVDQRYPVMLKVGNEDMLFADTPATTGSLYKTFCDFMSERKWGHQGVRRRGIKMIDGYLVDPENSQNALVRSMVVAKSGGADDDGSAGALVPARPKGPVPAIQHEL